MQPLLAVFAIYPSRARYVILDFLGDKCTAAVTSERYAGYAFIDAERRQVCWAHLLLQFASNPSLAPTTNAAEQALRSIVLKRKISGPTRSLRGDQFLSRGFSVHKTCLRQGRDLWEFMYSAVYAFIATGAAELDALDRPRGRRTNRLTAG